MTENEDDLNDINIEIQDIIDAIDKLEENSAPGPDGVPAIFLKKNKRSHSSPPNKHVKKKPR